METIPQSSIKNQRKTRERTMQAAVLTAPGNFSWQDTEIPTPGPDEVLIRMEGCGLCSSNIPIWEGRDWFNYPVEPGSPGHEGFGIVTDTGAKVKHLSPGDRVSAVSYNAFAEYDIANSDNVIKLPEELGKMDFPGEPLGCAMNIFKRSDIQPGQKVAIVGAGFLGSLLIQIAQSAGAEVMAISKRPFSLEVAKKLGCKTEILDDQQRVIEAIHDWTGGNWCERVIEATGKENALNLAGEITAVRGKLIVAGFHQDGPRKVNMQLWNWRGFDVINAHERDPRQYVRGIEAAIDATIEGIIEPAALCTHTFNKKEINEAFRILNNRPAGFVKGIIKFDPC